MKRTALLLLVALCLVYSSISGAIDNSVHLVAYHKILYGELVGDVELLYIGVQELVALV